MSMSDREVERIMAALSGPERRLMERIARRWGYRNPPESGLAVPAVPPKGPVPLEGGAEAPLEFD